MAENYCAGKSGGEAWILNSVGRLVSSGISAAVAVSPGAGTIYAEAADIFLYPAIEQGIDSVCYDDKQWEWSEYLGDVTQNIVANGVSSIMKVNKPIPKNIRDIKAEAVEQGIKGTHRLMSYLNKKQLTTKVKNAFRNKVASIIVNTVSMKHD